MHHSHHLELTVTDTPLVLDRIVSVCRARRCAILALRYEAADRHRPGRVLATIVADTQRARLATQRLAAMPGVLAVAHVGERAQRHSPGVSDHVPVGAARSHGSR